MPLGFHAASLLEAVLEFFRLFSSGQRFRSTSHWGLAPSQPTTPECETRSNWVGGELEIVVPAKVGTHNPWRISTRIAVHQAIGASQNIGDTGYESPPSRGRQR